MSHLKEKKTDQGEDHLPGGEQQMDGLEENGVKQ